MFVITENIMKRPVYSWLTWWTSESIEICCTDEHFIYWSRPKQLQNAESHLCGADSLNNHLLCVLTKHTLCMYLTRDLRGKQSYSYSLPLKKETACHYTVTWRSCVHLTPLCTVIENQFYYILSNPFIGVLQGMCPLNSTYEVLNAFTLV
jgi:hypothetical protein